MVGIPGHFKAGAKVVPKSLTQRKRIVRAPQLHLAPSDDQVLHCIILETELGQDIWGSGSTMLRLGIIQMLVS